VPRIFVLGSANMDLVLQVSRLPREGETLTGGDLALHAGGKGANQACAAARLGGRALIVGRVGDDPFGPRLIASLQESGVDVSRMGVAARPTGSACIYVLPGGENSIVLSPGANATLDPATALTALDSLEPGDLLLAQLEIPMETVEAAFAFAATRRATALLDPAPAQPLPPKLVSTVSVLTPNQTEAACILGDPLDSICTFDDAESAAARLVQLGAESVIVKLGALGCLWSDGKSARRLSAFKVDAIDTTAAGDVFNGALAVALAESAGWPEALRFASAAAAISVTRPGAQSSIPSRAEVDDFLLGPREPDGRADGPRDFI
jgi:ribokinase